MSDHADKLRDILELTDCSRGQWEPLLDRLVAEPDRLREALEQIESNVGWGDYVACACITDPHGPKVTCNCANEFRRIARAALAGKEEGT